MDMDSDVGLAQSLEFNPAGSSLLVASLDGRVFRFHASTGRLQQTLTARQGGTTTVCE